MCGQGLGAGLHPEGVPPWPALRMQPRSHAGRVQAPGVGRRYVRGGCAAMACPLHAASFAWPVRVRGGHMRGRTQMGGGCAHMNGEGAHMRMGGGVRCHPFPSPFACAPTPSCAHTPSCPHVHTMHLPTHLPSPFACPPPPLRSTSAYMRGVEGWKRGVQGWPTCPRTHWTGSPRWCINRGRGKGWGGVGSCTCCPMRVSGGSDEGKGGGAYLSCAAQHPPIVHRGRGWREPLPHVAIGGHPQGVQRRGGTRRGHAGRGAPSVRVHVRPPPHRMHMEGVCAREWEGGGGVHTQWGGVHADRRGGREPHGIGGTCGPPHPWAPWWRGWGTWFPKPCPPLHSASACTRVGEGQEERVGGWALHPISARCPARMGGGTPPPGGVPPPILAPIACTPHKPCPMCTPPSQSRPAQVVQANRGGSPCSHAHEGGGGQKRGRGVGLHILYPIGRKQG
jgi:hypothetical protein